MIPIFDTDLIKEKIIAHLSDAKKSIEIALARFTDTDLERALLAAMRRGVKVSLVLNDNETNRRSNIEWDELCTVGAALHWYLDDYGSVMNYKFCIVDKRFCLFGTYDWVYPHNKETLFALDNDTTASIFRLEFQNLLKEQSVSPHELDKSEKVGLEFGYGYYDDSIWFEVDRQIDFLDLEGLNIKGIPRRISQLKNLSCLKLNENKLMSLPENVLSLTNLTALYLNDNKLTSLASEIGLLSNLTLLNLGDNKLTSLPSEIGQLSNLRFLNLIENKLTSLPNEIGQLRNLISLDLNCNDLTYLPKEIGQLINLTSLNLRENQLITLPMEINQLINLNQLDLTDNKFSSDEEIRIKRLLPNCKVDFNAPPW